MTATTPQTPERVTINHPPHVTDDPDAMQQLLDGLCNAAASGSLPELDAVEADEYGAHASFAAWDKLVDAAVASIAPEVAQMLEDAIADRLPWTWEPDR